MGWEFEHWDNGKLYLHEERWAAFKKNIEKYGNHPHTWEHERIFFHIHTPRDVLFHIPIPGDEELKYKIQEVEKKWSTAYEPFPAFTRTEHDPEGWLPSWNIFAEDKNPQGEPISILTTGTIDQRSSSFLLGISGLAVRRNVFAFFRNQFWILDSYHEYGVGPNKPVKKSSKSKHRRNIFDPFEESAK